MTPPLLYVTGTNTGVGKTTISCLLLRRAGELKMRVAAMKPFCSGGRDDAEKLHAFQTAGLTLDEVNPFYFRDAVTPSIAARNENRVITLGQTIDSITKMLSRGKPLLIEGAGGLLSPLGDRFTLLEIIREIPGKVCIVGQNSLGVINATLLTHRALPPQTQTHIVLMNPLQCDASADTNASVITEWISANVIELPFLEDQAGSSDFPDVASKSLDELLRWWIE